MATLVAQDVRGVTGKVVTTAAAAVGGDRAPVGDDLFLLVRNGSGASIDVTFDVPGLAFNGTQIPDTVVAVAAGADRMVPLSTNYRSDSDGLAAITYSAVTTVTVAVIQA